MQEQLRQQMAAAPPVSHLTSMGAPPFSLSPLPCRHASYASFPRVCHWETAESSVHVTD